MNITEKFLTPNKYSRPQYKLKEIRAVVMHWTANARAGAMANRNYFDALKTGDSVYASAHYIIGQDGLIVYCIPENEIAYHCGTKNIDPASKKVYTDFAREKFGSFYTSANSSPNFCTIGIELCNIDDAGNFTEATIQAAVELVTNILKRYNLTVNDITTHNAIVGWKDCPRLWVNKPDLFEAFKTSVQELLNRR